MSSRKWLRRQPRAQLRLTGLEDRITPTAMPPDLQVLSSYLSGWTVNTTTSGGRELRFATAMANGGLGAFEIRGTTNYTTLPDGTQRQLVNQRVYQSDGTYVDRAAGNFVYHPAHGHIHFDDMALGQLRIRTAGNGLGDVVASGPKTSFFLLDLNHFNPSLPNSPASAVYNSSAQIQGISVGWTDVYNSGLEGQSIDITGVPNGDYWLEVTCDPLDHILESNKTNNTTRIPITLSTLPDVGFRVLSASPTGASDDPVSYVEYTFNQAVDPATFTASDATVTGPNGPIPVTGITAVSTVKFRVNFATQTAVGTYSITIGPDIRTTTGALLDQNNNGTGGEAADVFSNIFTVTAPRFLGTTPAASINPPFSTLRLMFSKSIQTSSFTISDISQFTGPGGVNLRSQITGIVPVSTGTASASFDINFTAQTALGNYTMVIEPTITDLNGNSVDMNGDGLSNASDRYTATIAIVPIGTVGPDTFGYDAHATTLQNLELVGQSNAVSLSFANTDDGTLALNLGANRFNFYGTTYTGNNQLFVSANGLVSFGTDYNQWQNDDLSTATMPVIAALWDDWDIGLGSPQVLAKYFDDNADGTSDRLVVEWNQIRSHNSSTSAGGITFQLVLQLNTGNTPGDILFNYPDLATTDQYANGASASAGLRSPSGVRLVVSNSGSNPIVGNGKAIALGVPHVQSITRVDPNPANAGSIQFLVTFTHPVTGVDVADFALTTTGSLAGGRVDHIHPTADPAVYEVHCLSGYGAGTARLDVIDDDTIVSNLGSKLGGTGAGNGSYAAGSLYNVVQPPPRIQGINIGDGTSQRSSLRQIQVIFDYPVTFVGTPSTAFEVTGPNGLVAVTVDLSLSTAAQTVARLTFSGPGTDFGSLADGRYTLRIIGSRIQTGGVALDGDGNGTAGGDRISAFHRLYGDMNGDGDVDGSDLVAFVPVVFNASNYLAALDFDNDGDVDGTDLSYFVSRLFTVLP